MSLYYLLLAVCLLPYSVAAQNAPGKKPNIIYIFADDLGYGELGCYGQQKMKTPHIDRLAAEGMRFTQHYTGTPVCAPSRCILMTGQHSGHAYIRGNYGLPGYIKNVNENGQFPLPDSIITIADLLKKTGYATAAMGKWGLGNYDSEGAPLKHGFDYFYGYYDQRPAHNYYPTHLWENSQWDSIDNPVIDVHPEYTGKIDTAVFSAYIGNEYAIDKMTAEAIQFIQHNKSNPFFLYLPYTLIHVALQAPDAAVREYIGEFNEQPYYGQRGYSPSLYPLSTYAAMVTYLDKQVGIIMALVKELGLDENTIVMFSSDNGPTFAGGVDPTFFNSTGNLRGLKMDVYEGGIREPFIARWPGKIPAGEVSDLISAHYDMMETFADLLNITAPKNDGISLLPTLLGKPEQQKNHEYLYWEYPEKGGQNAIRMGKWKGVKTGMFENNKAKWHLYNLETDVQESKDLASQHPEIIKQFDQVVQKEHTPPVREEWDIYN